MAKKSKKLVELQQSINDEEMSCDVEDLNVKALRILRKNLDNLTDSRNSTSYQEMGDIVIIVLLSTLANCNDFVEIYEYAVRKISIFKQFCKLEYGIPSLSTIKRVIAIIDTKELESICLKFIKRIVRKTANNEEQEKKVFSYDGKTIKGSARKDLKNGKQKPVNAMTAYNTTDNICLKTEYIEKKTNEIPTMLELLECLNLRNTISTFDALNTQQKTIKKIVSKHGDYVAPVKGNHKLLYEDLVDYFNDEELKKKAKEKGYITIEEKAHNQYEKREYILTDDIAWIDEKNSWANLKTIGICIRTCVDKNENKTVEKRYYITSLSVEEIENFKKAVRDEWKIENNLHWHLDYTFKEDSNLTVDRNAQQNLNIIRKICLSLLKIAKPLYPNKSLKKIRFILNCNFENEIVKMLNFIENSGF